FRSSNGIAGSGAVINCTVAENEGVSIEAEAVYNSIVDGTMDSPEIRFTLAPVLHGGLGNQSGAATFVNAAGGNYRLAEGSAGLDAGRNEYNTLSMDLGGLPRIFNIIDLGAYEKVSQGGLAVSLMSDPNPLPIDDALRYTVYVVNQGPNAAQGVEVACPLGNGISCLSNSVGSTYMNGRWTVGDISAGQMRQLYLWCVAEEAGCHTNVAVVSASMSDPIQPGYGVSTNVTQVLGEVSITNVSAFMESNSAVVEWESAVGMSYNVYAHDGPLVNEPDWALRANMVASEEVRHYVDSLASGQSTDRRYYQVTYPGHAPSPSNIWAVISRDVLPGFTLMSPPVQTDQRFDGELGRALAEELHGKDGGIGSGADEIYILQPDGGWRMLYLDAAQTWHEEDGRASTFELPAGQGFWVMRKALTGACITFTGPVGNAGTHRKMLQTGFNLIGLSQGKDLPIMATFQTANPVGGAAEETADQLVFQNPNGSWRRLIYIQGWGAPFDGNWFDLGTFQIVTPHEVLEPGQAYYYLRRGGVTSVAY
ncbi:MAG: DUF11 domain-containing protein, partial [Kiritimatiellia bacterium]|nr:DUF11 domain-containing protein [Kiritimatiellia bacterium]